MAEKCITDRAPAIGGNVTKPTRLERRKDTKREMWRTLSGDGVQGCKPLKTQSTRSPGASQLGNLKKDEKMKNAKVIKEETHANGAKYALAKVQTADEIAKERAESLKAIEDIERSTADGTRIDYKFVRTTIRQTKTGKQKINEGCAFLRVNFGRAWVTVGDLVKTTMPELAEYSKPFNALTVKIAKVELADKLGVAITDDARKAAKEAKTKLEERAAKKLERDIATIIEGRRKFQTKASKAAGERWDKLSERITAEHEDELEKAITAAEQGKGK